MKNIILEKELKKYFNFKEFRPGQKEIVEAIINNRDTVALMPTGGGKSLCYQLPAVVSEGLSVIISPLIALMKDQVSALNERGISAAFLNSSVSLEEAREIMSNIKRGEIKILYIAPERLANPGFQKFFAELDVSLLAVDEAHCLSQWGHDFRPNYLQIKNYIRLLKKRPTIAAFTATATPEVKDDIINQLDLKQPEVFIRGFDRPNLVFLTQNNLKPKERYTEVLRIVESLSGSGIIYALTRKETETITEFLSQNGIKTIAYHAGLDGSKREQIQNDFMKDKFRVIVATVAFGMGVDKSDVRFVIHSGMPKSLEGYYQEAGRAGRDGKRSYCVLLHAKKDVSTHKFFIRKDREDMQGQGKNPEEMWRILKIKYNALDRITEYATGGECRRLKLLKYFNDPAVKSYGDNCRGCDICLGWQGKAGKQEQQKGKKRFLGSTVKQSGDLYSQGGSISQIAKARNLQRRTIVKHLVEWYKTGGDLKIDELVSPYEQKQIKRVIAEVGMQRLRPIKENLPEKISYEKIQLTVAKIQLQEEDKN
ncbi:MAG: RecQ family ATP-dependent DNA helicase [Candidatus Moraniibacteriota bacterium]